jgi:hypothetical protein
MEIILRKWGFVEFPFLDDTVSQLKPKENHHLQKMILKHLSAFQTALEVISTHLN